MTTSKYSSPTSTKNTRSQEFLNAERWRRRRQCKIDWDNSSREGKDGKKNNEEYDETKEVPPTFLARAFSLPVKQTTGIIHPWIGQQSSSASTRLCLGHFASKLGVSHPFVFPTPCLHAQNNSVIVVAVVIVGGGDGGGGGWLCCVRAPSCLLAEVQHVPSCVSLLFAPYPFSTPTSAAHGALYTRQRLHCWLFWQYNPGLSRSRSRRVEEFGSSE